MFKEKIKKYLPLIIVVIIAIFFRLYNLNSVPPGLYPDEAMNGNNALEAITTSDYKVFYPENNGREGLFINIQALLLKLFGQNEPWVLRLASSLFGILTVVGIYFLSSAVLDIAKKRYQDQFQKYWELIPFLSSFFTAVSFWHINFSRIGFRAIMAPAFLVWGIFFLIKSLDNDSQKKSLIWGLISGVIYGLGMHSYIAYRATPLLIIFVFIAYKIFFKTEWKKIIWPLVLFGLGAVIVFSPLGMYFLQNPNDFLGRTSQVSIFSSENPLLNLADNILKTIGMFFFSGDYNWRHNYAGAPQVYWPVGILFALGIIYGLVDLFRKKVGAVIGFYYAICLFWLIVASLPVIISNEGIPHALRAVLMIPPTFIIASLGLIYLISLAPQINIKKPSLIILSTVILLCLTAQTYYFYFSLWIKNKNTQDAFAQKYVGIGKTINSVSPQIKKYVVVNTGGVDVRGIPMPAQTIMFITDSFTAEKQEQKNIHYIKPEEENKIKDDNSLVFYLE